MRPFSAFAATGSWFRGNCHTHTTISDGLDAPANTCDAYRAAGYDFVVLTDHRLSQPDIGTLQRRGFLVINGVELHPATRRASPGAHHIVAIGVESHPPVARAKRWTARRCVRWVHENGGIAVYAHPYWSGHDVLHMEEGQSAFGVEVFNGVCEQLLGLGDSSPHFDQALAQGFRWRAFATDDAHRFKRDAGAGWIMVKSRTLTRSAILAAIRKGHFYATTGPEIHAIRLRRGTVRVECSPVRDIVFHAWGPLGRRISGKGLRSEAEFPMEWLRDGSNYLRVEIVDAKGRKAWSQPIWRNTETGRWGDDYDTHLRDVGYTRRR